MNLPYRSRNAQQCNTVVLSFFLILCGIVFRLIYRFQLIPKHFLLFIGQRTKVGIETLCCKILFGKRFQRILAGAVHQILIPLFELCFLSSCGVIFLGFFGFFVFLGFLVRPLCIDFHGRALGNVQVLVKHELLLVAQIVGVVPACKGAAVALGVIVGGGVCELIVFQVRAVGGGHDVVAAFLGAVHGQILFHGHLSGLGVAGDILEVVAAHLLEPEVVDVGGDGERRVHLLQHLVALGERGRVVIGERRAAGVVLIDDVAACVGGGLRRALFGRGVIGHGGLAALDGFFHLIVHGCGLVIHDGFFHLIVHGCGLVRHGEVIVQRRGLVRHGHRLVVEIHGFRLRVGVGGLHYFGVRRLKLRARAVCKGGQQTAAHENQREAQRKHPFGQRKLFRRVFCKIFTHFSCPPLV